MPVSPLARPPTQRTRPLIVGVLRRFHCIYWPAFLMAAGLPLPGQVVAHGHWTLDGQKVGKEAMLGARQSVLGADTRTRA